MLLAAIDFASKDEARFNLNGVHIRDADGYHHVVATNGHMMFVGARKSEKRLRFYKME